MGTFQSFQLLVRFSLGSVCPRLSPHLRGRFKMPHSESTQFLGRFERLLTLSTNQDLRDIEKPSSYYYDPRTCILWKHNNKRKIVMKSSGFIFEPQCKEATQCAAPMQRSNTETKKQHRDKCKEATQRQRHRPRPTQTGRQADRQALFLTPWIVF